MQKFKRKYNDEVFAIKGFYSFEQHKEDRHKYPKNYPATVKGSFEMDDTVYNYEIDCFAIHLSTGEDNPALYTSHELWKGDWMVFNPNFTRYEWPFMLMDDAEFKHFYSKMTDEKLPKRIFK